MGRDQKPIPLPWRAALFGAVLGMSMSAAPGWAAETAKTTASPAKQSVTAAPAKPAAKPAQIQAAVPKPVAPPKPAAPIVAAAGTATGIAAIAALVRADKWEEAEDAAHGWLDPVARKLITFYRLLGPGGRITELDSFIGENPDWPSQQALSRRREEALASEPDDGTALGYCEKLSPRLAFTLMRCSDAYAAAGKEDAATGAARAAWVAGISEEKSESKFLAKYGKSVAPEDDWRRYVALAAGSDAAALKRQAARLVPPFRQAVEAREALRKDDRAADALYAALPATLRADPLVLLEAAQHLRRTATDEEAAKLWADLGETAQHQANAERLPAFWAERNRLARRLLAAGRHEATYGLAARHGLFAEAREQNAAVAEAALDAEFLAGWIALRKLEDPSRAEPHFRALANDSKSAITQGRAHYWLARTAAARKDSAKAKQEYALAAAWPTSFYGQLAALALNEDPAALNARIKAVKEPGYDPSRAHSFAAREVARAATMLASWGEKNRARAFLYRLDELASDSVDRLLTAKLALGFGATDQAVALSRRAGRDGLMLPETGWPMPYAVPEDGDAPLALGVMRQESNFDVAAQSQVGARGLMQLMPATARAVAAKLGIGVSPAALVTDPDKNIRLGTAYMRGLVDSFQGSVPLAVAGYNAGPGRVGQWLAENGDPRSGVAEMIDWIEQIPFSETRNYVQRVIENMQIYRARRDIVAPHPLAGPLG